MPLVYDIYGTLLDVDAAARKVAERDEAFAEHWVQLSAGWRQRQLSYSWLRSLMGRYVPFWQITTEALDVTMGEMGLNDPQLRENLLTLYLDLMPYDEVTGELTKLKANGHKLAALSNGSPEMLERGLTSSGIGPLLDAALSVDVLKSISQTLVFMPWLPIILTVSLKMSHFSHPTIGISPGQVHLASRQYG